MALLGLGAAAAAEPVSFAHGTADQQFTTTPAGAPSGFTFSGAYHAAGDAQADPRYMRRIVFYNPPGTRYDTSVPDRCTASDLELETQGPAACPPGSVLGKGSGGGRIAGTFAGSFDVFLLNNADQQVLVTRTPLSWTVSRGRIHPDGSIEYASPTCRPSNDPPGGPVDDALQLRASMNVPAYVKASRSYITTPPTCQASGQWETPIKYWWADGTQDTVLTEQPCASTPS